MIPNSLESTCERLYEALVASGLEFGRLFPYAELDAAAGQPIRPSRSVLYRTVKLLEERQQRTLVNVPRQGYRIALAGETPAIADRRVKRGQRQIGKAIHTARHTDTSPLTQEERNELHRVLSGLEAMRQELVRIKRRMARTESRVEELESRPQLSPAEIEALRDLLSGSQGR